MALTTSAGAGFGVHAIPSMETVSSPATATGRIRADKATTVITATNERVPVAIIASPKKKEQPTATFSQLRGTA